MSWFKRLWSPAVAQPVAPAPSKPSPPVPAAAVAPAQPVASTAANEPAPPPFIPWLAGQWTPAMKPMTAHEQHTLEILQAVLDLPTVPDALLPRAAEVVPQLIALLRETQLPLQAIAQRVSKEPLLAAEVLRLASSPYYRAQGEVTDLEQGIRLIGSAGLQSAIARVVLKPIYRSTVGTAGSPHARAIARLWEHSEALAERAADLADAAGQAGFDGYLLGMLHDTGWKVTIASLDKAKYTLVEQPTAAFVGELVELTHRLFGLAAQRWAITPGFAALAADARANGLARGQQPLADVLRQALRHCASNVG